MTSDDPGDYDSDWGLEMSNSPDTPPLFGPVTAVIIRLIGVMGACLIIAYLLLVVVPA
jgi:hypothetical protein